MALSDCEKCWDTPCTCGWDYRNYTIEALTKFVKGVISKKPKEEQLQIIRGVLNKLENEAKIQ